jgi:hypothetical protein
MLRVRVCHVGLAVGNGEMVVAALGWRETRVVGVEAASGVEDVEDGGTVRRIEGACIEYVGVIA